MAPLAPKPLDGELTKAVAPSATCSKAKPIAVGAFPANVTEANADARLNAKNPIDVTDAGITIDSTPEPSKVALLIEVRVESASKVTDVNASVFSNANSPISVTEAGMTIEASVERENAAYPIEVRAESASKVTDVNAGVFSNA
jgi:hypothetical protein